MSCSRICKTTPCTFPACATAEQHAAYAEGREDAELDAARVRVVGACTGGALSSNPLGDVANWADRPARHYIASRAAAAERYDAGYSDGYDAALIESGKPDVAATALLCVGVFMFGVLAGWAFL